MFHFPDFFEFLYLWTRVREMIEATMDSAREFVSEKVIIVLTLLAKATSIVILIAITRFSPSMVSLEARVSAVYVLSTSVSSIAALVFTYVVSRIWVGIIQLLEGLRLLCRHWLYEVSTIMWCISHGGSLWIWERVVGVVGGSMVRFHVLVEGRSIVSSSRSICR